MLISRIRAVVVFALVASTALVSGASSGSAADGTTNVTLEYASVFEYRNDAGELTNCNHFGGPSSVTSDSPIALSGGMRFFVFVLTDSVSLQADGPGPLTFTGGSIFLRPPNPVPVDDVSQCDGLTVSFDASTAWSWLGISGERDPGTAQVVMAFHDGGATVDITLPFVVEAFPDQDFDGIWDVLERGAEGTFDDGAGTFGSVPIYPGIRVADVDPGGVLVENGNIPHDFTISACGLPVHFASDTEAASAAITCGSITVKLTSGSVTITLGSGSTVQVKTGGWVRVAETADSFTVENLGTSAVTVTVNGTPTELGVDEIWRPGPVTRDDCRNGGWRGFGYKNEGGCIADVVRP